MKKISLVALLSIAFIPACFKKKVDSQRENTVLNEASGSKTSTVTEDAQEFLLEDEANFNAFDDSKPSVSNIENSNDLDWSEVEENINDEAKTGTVQFEYNSSKIKQSEEDKIRKNTKLIKEKIAKNKKAKVLVKGHSCKIAKNKEYNYALSQERAHKVAKVYEQEGIPTKNVKSVGYGATMLLTDKDGMEEQAINRRAETVVAE